ncbi:ethanolamine utilization protein EutN [candidate division KSB1 bacterium]|jgi:ethanolamine utilization protein EutN|nr:ethanolamine utilization protein EutN [candidate division KSB1 bacterium]
MILAKIIGSVVSTVKHECYNHHKLLLAKPVSPQGKPQSGVILAVDAVGAGKGDVVLVASEGRAATELLGFPCRMPLRSVILAIVDDPEQLASTLAITDGNP